MATLRIEHAIHDYETWHKAFDSFAEARTKAGVRGFAIRQPVDDPKYLMLDIEFDTTGQAEGSPSSCISASGPLQLHLLPWPARPRPGSSTSAKERNAAESTSVLMNDRS